MNKFLSIAVIAALMTACAQKQPVVYSNNGLGASSKISLKSVNTVTKPAHSLYEFSINMFDCIHKELDTNVVCSPLGTATLYRIIQDGASNESDKEMGKVLGVSSEEISKIAKDLNDCEYIEDEDEDNSTKHFNSTRTRVKMGNILVANNNKSDLSTLYKYKMQRRYDTDVWSMDFSDAKAVDKINDYVCQNTSGQIGKIFENLPPQASLVGVNTLCFKGRWHEDFEFYKHETKKKKFNNADGKHSVVDMMNRYYKELRYAHNDVFQVISLPYNARKNDAATQRTFSMMVFLPMKDKSLNDVMEYLHNHDLTDIYHSMKKERVKVWLPRFSTDMCLDIRSIMRSLGLADPLELPAISSEKMTLDNSLQFTKISVDEEGTVAAAVTEVECVSLGVLVDRPKKKTVRIYNFYADHPFIYMIKNNETNTIYFMGKFIEGRKATGDEEIITNQKTEDMPLFYDKEIESEDDI